MRELEGVVKQQNQTLNEMRLLMSRMRERAAASHGAQARLVPDSRPRKKLLLVRHGEAEHKVSAAAEPGSNPNPNPNPNPNLTPNPNTNPNTNTNPNQP